ncbi:hypothetical protein PS862_00238 [Pseudomonas fluorescens]|uniref:Lipoprotein n=1 Tax=Pseudomonas fluorescens TaxID=294 RepID=A0A5E7GFR0_PSEFL|nr:hypothetical protein [Pseudomonas fluorescens]VVO49537.1 hypothetical protein PS862_00238 [Pseudomonas fluorescens]
MKKLSSQVSPMRLVALTLLSLISTYCSSNDEPLPEDTLLNSLPESARMVVKKAMTHVNAYDRNVVSFDGRTVYEDIVGSSNLCYSKHCVNKESFPWLSLMYHHTLSVGEVFSIAYSPASSSDELFSLNGYVLQSGVKTKDYLGFHIPSGTKNQAPRTVGDFNKLTNYTFQFIYDDPKKFELYPGMDKEIALEIEMKKITDMLKSQQYEEALPRFRRVFKALDANNMEIEEVLAYYYVFTLDKTGRKNSATSLAKAYLDQWGKKGAHYSEMVEIASKQ